MKFDLDIKATLYKLLSQEDTDGDKKITIEDQGPKEFAVISDDGGKEIIKGTYHLSNLLQELVIQKLEGRDIANISIEKIKEPPVNRISRMIREYYWSGLTRTMDSNGVSRLINDDKNDSLTANILPVYVPYTDKEGYAYYKELEKKLPIVAVKLPEYITPQYVKSIDTKPGILSLKLENRNGEIKGVPFVVPGGRFNEMYGWDSYFESVGLLLDGKVHLAKAMADNFQYQIEHYGKILNANRSYYLTRTQPPFYSSLISEVYEIIQDKAWLQSHLKTAIKEYESVWMEEGKRRTPNGLNRYLAEGFGIPPETEKGHFDAYLHPFAKELNISIEDYILNYNSGMIKNPALDLYFLHDRTVRESGHDTSYRLDGNCADLNLVELNAMLYKYETDFATLIKNEFDDSYEGHNSAYWLNKSAQRKESVNTYMWNQERGMYFDFDVVNNRQSDFVAVTTLTPLWANMCTKEQADVLVQTAIPLLKEQGGLAGCTQESVGIISESRPQRQWDYPNGWAPHQMMVWKGLLNYGYNEITQELIYRWLFMITKNAVDYNGTIPEKYDVVEATHKVFAEYGNVGTDFNYITQEGFGWMNASYQYGLSLLQDEYLDQLNQLTPPEALFL